jgi:hypothetical protein
LDTEEDFLEERESNGEEKGRPLSRNLDCKGKMFANFYYFLAPLSTFATFTRLSLRFFHKTFFNTHSRDKK